MNWKAMFPFDVKGLAWMDPAGTIAGLRMLNAADNASKVPFTRTSGFGDPPIRKETFPSVFTLSVMVSVSVLKAQA